MAEPAAHALAAGQRSRSLTGGEPSGEKDGSRGKGELSLCRTRGWGGVAAAALHHR